MRSLLLFSLLFPLLASADEAVPKHSDRPVRVEGPLEEKRWLVPTMHSVGVLAGMRTSLSVLWPEHFHPLHFDRMGAQIRSSWSTPPSYQRERSFIESDGDPWTLNAVGHGLFGSEIYLRFRQCGHRPLAALASAAVTSTVWEYGIEAFHKQPSGIDLLWTPLVGSMLGEGRYRLYRLIRGEEEPAAGRAALLFVVDPFGEAERRILGTDC